MEGVPDEVVGSGDGVVDPLDVSIGMTAEDEPDDIAKEPKLEPLLPETAVEGGLPTCSISSVGPEIVVVSKLLVLDNVDEGEERDAWVERLEVVGTGALEADRTGVDDGSLLE